MNYVTEYPRKITFSLRVYFILNQTIRYHYTENNQPETFCELLLIMKWASRA